MTPQPPRLWLVRHAAPGIAAGTCYGALDVEADVAGTHEAARRLAAALPADHVLVRHSPLARCAQLARALEALRPDLAARPDARLAEMDFGTWEGRAWNAIGRAAVDAWTADFAGHAPGGGESLARMLARVASALAEARAACAAQTAGDVVWITHAGVARCVRWCLQAPGRMPRADEWPVAAPAFGEWNCVDLLEAPGSERGRHPPGGGCVPAVVPPVAQPPFSGTSSVTAPSVPSDGPRRT